MNVLIIGKYPPIQGGVSAETYWIANKLCEIGNTVSVVTNAEEAAPNLRACLLDEDDKSKCFQVSDRLTIFNTSHLVDSSYIPYANPYASKLLGLALEVTSSNKFHVIIGSYLEPYCVVAHLLSTLTNIPFIIKHAGSDIGKLAFHKNLAFIYRRVFEDASACIGPSKGAIKTALGVVVDNGLPFNNYRLNIEQIIPKSELDMGYISKAGSAWINHYSINENTKKKIIDVNNKSFDTSLLTIGIFGKVHKVKGCFYLAKALNNIALKRYKFNFLSLSGGKEREVEEFYSYVLEQSELMERSWLSPFITPWKVPSFLSKCDIVAFLEHDFPIKFHGPRIPREVLALGKCLVLSAEIANKEIYGKNFVHRKNCIIIDDPSDISSLERELVFLIENDEARRTIAKHGKALSDFIELYLPSLETELRHFTEFVRELI